jgi:hypothetical protein
MKVALTGWGGFLATKLRTATDIEWTEDRNNCDMLILMGSPTFTDAELDQHDAQVMHQYVRETIRIIDRFDGPVIFASTTGVDDIQLDHRGSTSYNLAKLYLENYVMYNCDVWTILRIGTIISMDPADLLLMKQDRIQPRIKRKDLANIDWKDNYLLLEHFINTTLDRIRNFKTGIVEYQLTQFTIAELTKL